MNAYDRGEYNSSFALRAVELKKPDITKHTGKVMFHKKFIFDESLTFIVLRLHRVEQINSSMFYAKIRKNRKMKISHFFICKMNYHFYSREILQYIVWASYRNGI